MVLVWRPQDSQEDETRTRVLGLWASAPSPGFCKLIKLCLLPLFLQIFGGLVWILVGSTYVIPQNPQGWVMAVSVFCFVMTFVWLVVFACGVHHNKASWAAAVSRPRAARSSCVAAPSEFSCPVSSSSVRTSSITYWLRPSTSVLPRIWPT